jgi:hypothetical protein
MSQIDSEVVAAIDTFVGAIVFSKRLFGPYRCTRIEDLWVMHDDPGRKGARKTEIVAYGKSPAETADAIARANLGRCFLCDVHPQDRFDERRRGYKDLGYRAMGTEWFFIHSLEKIPVFESVPPVRLVSTQPEADAIPQLSPHKLKIRDGTRDYRIWNDSGDYGWVRSLDVGSASWVQGLHVREPLRRMGYGSALMSRLLRDDKALGRTASVLLANSAGSKLYPLLGYQEIAILQVFQVPNRT